MKKYLFIWILLISSISWAVEYPRFDRGPDPKDPMQKELIEILSDMPYLPGISQQLQVLVPSYKRGQKMRPDFGAMPMRGFAIPNSISVLVIGQDGTHIAEGANRPGIAGFGGRVHDMLLHFGVLEGVIFTNLYVNTISGQYGSRNTPVILNDKQLVYTNVIENRQWMMTHEGPYGEWRNRFLSWVIRNNLDSLKMVIMLGQAGKDAGANFVNFIGGQVGPRRSVKDGSQYQVPWFEMESAGGNNEWAVPVTAEGKDVAEVLRQDSKIRKALQEKLEKELAEAIAKGAKRDQEIFKKRINALAKPLDYRDGTQEYGVSVDNARDLLTDNFQRAKSLMVFSRGGPQKNGVLYPQQFGGWDLNTMKVNGKFTRSIKGLNIPCLESRVGPCKGKVSVDAPDIVFVGAPHPTSLSMGEMTRPGSAAQKVEKELLAPLRSEVKRGWKSPAPERGLSSAFVENKPYRYGRGIIPPSHGDPGITDFRLLPVSTAQRSGSSVIVIGTRDRAQFDKNKIKSMERDAPSEKWLPRSHGVLTGRPQFEETLYEYDRGPDEKYASLLFDQLEKKSVFWVNDSYAQEADELYKKETRRRSSEEAFERVARSIYSKHGIKSFPSKSHPDAGFFGHYRGTFEKPKVVIVYDPVGYDSFITSKAATGERGQYLNGLMRDLGVGDQYLVLKTVPFGMDGATDEEWQIVLERTQGYLESLVTEIKKDARPLFIADGPYASQMLNQILGSKNFKALTRLNDQPESGIRQFGQELAGKRPFAKVKKNDITGDRIDIPRSHLTWIARVWEGTSGDRVITAQDKGNEGMAFAIVAPNWARRNKVYFSDWEKEGITEMLTRLATAGEPQPGESIKNYVLRRENCVSLTEYKESKDSQPCGLVEAPLFPSAVGQ